MWFQLIYILAHSRHIYYFLGTHKFAMVTFITFVLEGVKFGLFTRFRFYCSQEKLIVNSAGNAYKY